MLHAPVGRWPRRTRRASATTPDAAPAWAAAAGRRTTIGRRRARATTRSSRATTGRRVGRRPVSRASHTPASPLMAAMNEPKLTFCRPHGLTARSAVPDTLSTPPSAPATRSLVCQWARGPVRPNGVSETWTSRGLTSTSVSWSKPELGEPPRRRRLDHQIGLLGEPPVGAPARLARQVVDHDVLAAVEPPVEQPTSCRGGGSIIAGPRMRRAEAHDRCSGLRQHLSGETSRRRRSSRRPEGRSTVPKPCLPPRRSSTGRPATPNDNPSSHRPRCRELLASRVRNKFTRT